MRKETSVWEVVKELARFFSAEDASGFAPVVGTIPMKRSSRETQRDIVLGIFGPHTLRILTKPSLAVQECVCGGVCV